MLAMSRAKLIKCGIGLNRSTPCCLSHTQELNTLILFSSSIPQNQKKDYSSREKGGKGVEDLHILLIDEMLFRTFPICWNVCYDVLGEFSASIPTRSFRQFPTIIPTLQITVCNIMSFCKGGTSYYLAVLSHF